MVGSVERGGQVGDELVGAGEADFCVAHTEGSHALEQGDRVGDGDLEVGLLHAVAEAGVEEFDLSWLTSFMSPSRLVLLQDVDRCINRR